MVNYLDVSLNLESESYRPYRKPNNETIYIHGKSNHPRNIIKQLPLHKCGHDHTLQHSPIENENTNTNTSQGRKRNIIWFNPPFSKSVSTNIGKYFMNLLEKQFPKNHKYRKLFNRNNVKLSYSCMPNIKSIINNHNKNVLQENNNQNKTCNCIKKQSCPLGNQCLTPNIVYQ